MFLDDMRMIPEILSWLSGTLLTAMLARFKPYSVCIGHVADVTKDPVTTPKKHNSVTDRSEK